MKHARLILIAILLVVIPASGLGQKITKESMVSEGKKRSFYLYLPPTLKPEDRVPLVVLLHGSTHVGLSLAEKWKDLANKEGFIVVAPDSIDSAVWAIPADGPGFLRDLVEAMKGKYPINPRRVYLFGHSGGAGFALLMAFYESEYFAAISVHAGALDQRGMNLIKLAKRKTPIHLQVGNQDPLFPLPIVRETRDALKAQGFPVELKEIPNHDHGYYTLAPKINVTAWEFLKLQELAGDPVFAEHNFKKETRASKDARASATHYNRGMERLQAGDFAGAIAAFARVIETDGKDADAYNNRGFAYASQGNYEAALADYTRSIELKPAAVVYNNRGGIYFGLKKLDEAISDFSEAIKLQASAENYANRGLAYIQNGKDDLGLSDYDRAIQVDPKFGRAYVLRGVFALNKGQTEPAQKDLDMGFKLDPTLHSEFDSMISQIKAVRGLK